MRTMQRHPLGSLVFLVAGLTDIVGVLYCSQALGNAFLTTVYPELLSVPGLILIMLWGLASLAVAGAYDRVPTLVLVFCLRQFFYFGAWLIWMGQHLEVLEPLWAASPRAGLFMAAFGPVDLLFGLAFLGIWWSLLRRRPARAPAPSPRAAELIRKPQDQVARQSTRAGPEAAASETASARAG